MRQINRIVGGAMEDDLVKGFARTGAVSGRIRE